MTSEVVYAIYDKDSGLFVTRGLHSGLDRLGGTTLLFDTKHGAYKFKNNPVAREFADRGTTILRNNLAWWLLEKLYKIDRWHINCSKDEYTDAYRQFCHLKVVPINLEYNQA